MFEVFDHTADIGLRVEAGSFEQLLVEAGRGLLSLIVENTADVRAIESVPVRVDGEDPAYLLLDWLNELLYLFDTRRLLLSRFEVELEPGGIRGTAHGEVADPRRHHLDHEIKAITYHGLEARRVGQTWRAEVILDI